MNPLSGERLKFLERAMERFGDLPPEVFFKEDILRLGLALDWGEGSGGSEAVPAQHIPAVAGASADADSYQRKSYFIFSFDRTPIGEMPRQENLRAPEEIALRGGP